MDDISITCITASEARRRTAEVICAELEVPLAVGERVALEFRQLVCDAADENAGRPADRPAFIDRSGAERVAQQFIAEFDFAHLTAAIASGACEPVDLDTATPDDGYFKGVHAQPGHIAAGLPTERPEVVEAVVAGLSSQGAALLTGPSGVGKSTAMWMSAYMTRNVTWFRVNRLEPDDVEDLHRLATSRRPTGTAPVGLLVDGVGLGEIAAWDELVRRLAGTPNIYLLGSARVEDIFEVTTLSHLARIDVGLDEAVAERIFVNLREAALTRSAHWREAFNDSNGLTLEYTYLLTSGERLSSVLGTQVRRLVSDPDSDPEVQLLALVATAHSYGVDLPIAAAGRALDLADGVLRRAVARLKDEHLVVEQSGSLTGLHLMRSRTLAAAVHSTPPPDMRATVQRLLKEVGGLDLARLIVGLLRDRDDLDDVVLVATAERLIAAEPTNGLLVSVLHAVRSADYLRHARERATIIREADVPPALWAVTVSLALIDSVAVPDMHEAVAAAIDQLRARGPEAPVLWNRLVAELTVENVASMLTLQSSAAMLAALLAAIREASPDLVSALERQAWVASPAGVCLAEATADEFAHVCSAAQVVSDDLASALVAAAGGEVLVLSRIADDFPTVYEIGRGAADDGEPTAVARLGFIDDELTPDPDDTARNVARLLLRSLPGCSRADVQTVRAGGGSYRYGSLEFGTSGLLHRYALTKYETEWNRARGVLVLHELGFISPGEHAARVAVLLPRVADFFHRLLTIWITQRDEYLEWDKEWLTAEQTALVKLVESLSAPQDGVRLMQGSIPAMGERLGHPLGANDAEDGDEQGLAFFGKDEAHTVLQNVTSKIVGHLASHSHNQLAFFARNTAKSLYEAEAEEQWELAGLAAAPSAVGYLQKMLHQLADISAAIANEVVTTRDLVREARSGPRPLAVDRTAEFARSASKRRKNELLDALRVELVAGRVDAEVLERETDVDEGYWPPFDFALIVRCGDVEEWFRTQDVAGEAIVRLREGLYVPPTLLCPEIAGRLDRALAVDVQDSIYPFSQRFSEWFGTDDADADAPLVQAVEAATTALLRRSGLNYLRTLKQLPGSLELAFEETADTFDVSLTKIGSLGDDAVIDEICGDLEVLSQIVEEERTVEHGAGAVAAEMFDSHQGSSRTELVNTLLGLRALAVQWTYDVDAAVAWLHRLTTEE